MLVYLVQNSGRLVPKAELIDNVWQDVMVTENSLVQCIKEIRLALNDDAHGTIETVARRGYLFASPVVAVDDHAAPQLVTAAVAADGALPLVSAQLIDAIGGGHQWAERYDRELGDIFAVQDEITRSVVAAIEPRLLAAEGIRSLARSANDLGAWELVARAQTHVWRLNRLDYATAVDALNVTVETHPDYAPAQSLLAFCLLISAHMGWVDRDHGLRIGRQHAIHAVTLDDCDAWGQIALGYLALMEKRTDDSIAAFRRAVQLNPGSAATHGHLGHGLAFSGRDSEAIDHAEEAIRLSPLDPEMAMFLGAIAVAH